MSKEALIGRERIIDVLNEADIKITDDNIFELGDMGIFGSLWDYAENVGCGLEIMLDKISVRQETIEIFEELQINPYTYPSQGAWLIRSDKTYEIKDILNRAGITASIIGRETSNNDRIIINQDETRFLTPIDRLIKDEQGIRNLR